MKAVIQRVKKASVEIDGKIVGKIDTGLLVLLGVEDGDDEKHCTYMAEKIAAMRIFSDENGKFNYSVKDIDGEILAVSQFTLLADTKKGNRPSFINAQSPHEANRLYEYVLDGLRKQGLIVKKGVFGADMKINQTNDGPFTVMLESR